MRPQTTRRGRPGSRSPHRRGGDGWLCATCRDGQSTRAGKTQCGADKPHQATGRETARTRTSTSRRARARRAEVGRDHAVGAEAERARRTPSKWSLRFERGSNGSDLVGIPGRHGVLGMSDVISGGHRGSMTGLSGMAWCRLLVHHSEIYRTPRGSVECPADGGGPASRIRSSSAASEPWAGSNYLDTMADLMKSDADVVRTTFLRSRSVLAAADKTSGSYGSATCLSWGGAFMHGVTPTARHLGRSSDRDSPGHGVHASSPSSMPPDVGGFLQLRHGPRDRGRRSRSSPTTRATSRA